MAGDIFTREQVWKTNQLNGQNTKHDQRFRIALLLAVATVLLTCGIGGFVLGHDPVPGLQQEVADAQAQVVILQHENSVLRTKHTHCAIDTSDGIRLRQMVERGAYREAAALSDVILSASQEPLCPGSTIASLWYVASMDALFSTPVGSADDPTAVLSWRSIERRADALGLGPDQRDSSLTVFTYAYTNGVWSLARAAFQQALRSNVASVTDLTEVAKYYAVLRNEGHALAFAGTGSIRMNGLRLLATADAISRKAGLQRGEARADLTVMLGHRSGHWPEADAQDPILQQLEQR